MDAKIREIMTKDVVTIDVNSDVQSLVKKMLRYDVGNIIITDKKKPVGIVTEHDIFKKIVSKNRKPSAISIRELMTTPLVTVPPSEKVTYTVQKMIMRSIRRVPVVEKAKLVGIVTDTDIITKSPEMGSIFADIKKHRGKIGLSGEPLPGTSPSPDENLPGTSPSPKKSH